jgi:hypothetical protein
MQFQYMVVKVSAESGWTLGGKVDEGKLSNELNRLGAVGWELVSAFDTNMGYGATRDVVLILKKAV